MISSEQDINRLLATISLRIRQSLDVEKILQATVEEVCQLLKCDRVLVYRFEPDWSGTVTVEAVSNPQWSILGDVIRDPCFESAWIDKYQQGEVTHHENVKTVAIDECYRELLQHFNVQANLVAPILQPQKKPKDFIIKKNQGNSGANSPLSCSLEKQPSNINGTDNFSLWGLLIAHHCQKPRKWQELEINLLKQLANQVAIAIQQAELLQRTHQELRERQLAERQTQKVREFLQTVIDRLPVAVYVKDARQENFGKFQLWNQATEQIFNLEAPQVLGKTVEDYFPPEKAQDLIQQDLQVIEAGEALDIPEEQIDDGKGTAKIVHKIKVPLYDQKRQPEYLLCIAEDITARKKAELELRQKSEELTAFSENLKLLHRLNTTNYQSFEELFRDHLLTGCQMFNCSTGVVGLIEGDFYTIYAIESNLDSLHPQTQIPIKDTYCCQVIKQKKTVTYNCVGNIQQLCFQPLYQSFKFESYIGTPIFVDGSVFGTLCFTSQQAKNPPFSDREKETIEMMAQSIGRFIFADRVEKKRQEAEAKLTQAKKELEIRVLQRTAELEIANYRLHDELRERKQTQVELQASQDNLKESERRWRSLLENVRLLVVGIDIQEKVDYVNPYFLELIGYAQEEVINHNWFKNFIHPRDRQRAIELHNNIVNINFCCSHHYHQTTIVTKSGEAKTIAWNTTQLRNLEGVPTGMMCIGKDITESQAIERMKDEFISVVSHELRTPLTSIRGALGLLATGVLNTQSEKGERVIKIAAESTEHLVRLVDDILELERLESGKIELVIHQVKIQELIAQAINRVQIVANKEKITIKATESIGEFHGDGDRLLQVLTNLLSNAIKFSDSGSTIWLDVEFKETTDNPPQKIIAFAIRDRGKGIPADQLESIFERFHQVDASDSRRKGGTGLGLAICRSIVEQHGGKIWVDSVYGKGTTFYFNIPLEENSYQ
ncbi:putative Histidine kinase [Hyella patelloides LEGE 07179]|uniref:Circadian input-output histidine kinase CikA n=1 Tax=Hyella patelloides LEGE 07179 TaxID=945734 RepID=A0A563VPH9_9CYAN|nr:GAF domain-containing protein [Hyella patelloides]VEP13366.1 putative Histidine kinase [Hyella patelloides LEGE 07179]